MSKRLSKVPLCLAFVALFVFQGLNLDSDPSPLKRLGDFGDEGYWQHNSRCEVLFGTFVPDELNQAFIGAPLFTAFQWLSFSLFGVSIFTARLISLVSLWLVLLMLYGLMRQAFSAGQAMLAVVMLGLMHEMLMHAKWSTPILPEMCFLTAILFFWELGRKGSPGWMLLSGGCLIGAVATKLSSLYFVLAIVLFLLGAWGVRKEVDGKRLLLFVAGVALGTVALASFYLSNYAQLLSFAQTIGKANVSGHQSGWEIASRFVTIPLHWAFVLPGVCVLAMLSSLWFFEQIVTAIRHGFRWGRLSCVDCGVLFVVLACRHLERIGDLAPKARSSLRHVLRADDDSRNFLCPAPVCRLGHEPRGWNRSAVEGWADRSMGPKHLPLVALRTKGHRADQHSVVSRGCRKSSLVR